MKIINFNPCRMNPDEYPEFWQPALHRLKPQIDRALAACRDTQGRWNRYPAEDRVFEALRQCPVPKVAIVGQDPYYNPGEATGLCFSLPEAMPIPPKNSLRNIYLEMEAQGFQPPKRVVTRMVHIDGQDVERTYRVPTGDLTSWAQQGFLLLNASLTVMQGKPNCDAGLWSAITTELIMHMANPNPKVDPDDPGCCFVLWGGFAQKFCRNIDPKAHLVIKGAHPSPLSVHLFRGNDHFRQITAFLKEKYGEDMRWDPSDPLPDEPAWQNGK